MKRIDPDTTIGRVALTVANLDPLVDYYQEHIGLRLLRREAGGAWLGAGGVELLALHEDGAARPVPGAAGLYHFALLLPTRRDLAQTLQHLARSQTPLTGFADHLVSEAIYLSDPEGNGIEIYRDRPRAEWRRDAAGRLRMDTIALDIDGLLSTLDGEDPWTGLPAGSRVGHVHLHVGDLRDARAFYVDVLGFEHVLDYGGSASFVAAGGYHHHIGYNLWAGRAHRPAGASGLRWFEVRLPDQEGLAAVLERVRAASLPVTQADGGWMLNDPAGNPVRLVAG